MSKYTSDFAKEFRKDYKRLKDNSELRSRLKNKIEEILENPHHYKPLRNKLKNCRRSRLGNMVLLFEIIEEDKIVLFHAFKHHDVVYKKET